MMGPGILHSTAHLSTVRVRPLSVFCDFQTFEVLVDLAGVLNLAYDATGLTY